MNEEQFDELKRFVQTTVEQSESRLMAHIGGMERRLYEVEQRSTSFGPRLDSINNEVRNELQRIRYDVEQLQARIR